MRQRALSIAAGTGIAALGFALTLGSAEAAPKVVTSIKPVHALVAGVMQGVGTPDLLIEGAGSPHSYSLRPSEARALSQADLVVWVGPALETFLERPVAGLAEKAMILELAEVDGLALLETREGGAWEHDDHGEHGEDEHAKHDDHDEDEHAHDEHAHDEHAHDEHAHDEHAHDEHAHDESEHSDGHADDDHAEHAHGDHDMHVWLDPGNAIAIVEATVAALGAVDPDQAALYAGNGKAMVAQIKALDDELRTALAPVKDQPYVVFHDGYRYFEAHYGLNAVGSITVSPDRAPGAKRLSEIRDKIADLGALCVFSEPQFEPALVATVIEGTEARTGVLDPLGAGVAAGPGAYQAMMRDLAAGLTGCLKPAS